MYKITKMFPKYSEKDIEGFINENDFMDAYVELLKQTIEMLWQIIGLKYCDEEGIPKKIEKDDAILGGNLTRLMKLNTSFLQNICEGQLEICLILNRCIAETAINSKYMLIEGEDNVRRNYIKHSLITEKELWEIIKSNIVIRGGDATPIEIRMKNSVESVFDKSDFELDEVSRSSKWKSIKSRADIVAGEMFYSIYYGIASHSIHGNWQDIFSNNLKIVPDGFKLMLNWQLPKPQIIDGPIILNLDLVSLFTEKELSDNLYANIITENCKTLFLYQSILLENHEQFKTKNT